MSVQAAFTVIDGLDAALAAGLARLVPEQRAALTTFSNALAGSPLGGTVATAVESLANGDPSAHHLVAIAAGRAALLGAVADALLAEAGTPLLPVEVGGNATPTNEQRPRLEGLRQWLVEIALAGFGQLDAATLTPVLPTISNIQQTPGLGRLAALTSGFVAELLAHAPTSALAELPRRRWADLWMRSLLGTVALPEQPTVATVSGTFSVLGADIRQHDNLVSVVVHGVLDAGVRRFAHVTVNTWKVDAIAGAEAWTLIKPKAPELVAALATPAVLTITGSLASTGALTIEAVTASAPYDPFTLDLSGVALAPPAPRDRHPIQLAIPTKDASAAIDLTRSGPLLDLSADIADAASTLGLLRWDDGWRFQPMVIKTKKGKVIGAGASLALADKSKSDARAVLAERASKLLRA